MQSLQRTASQSRPAYARLDHDSGSDDNNCLNSHPFPHQRTTESTIARSQTASPSRTTWLPQPHRRLLPTARRFWAEFTLGFADGLTVPFALTAGLSSLGETDMLVYAGMAEVSAGCISMGIGGYLSARQAVPAASEVATATTDNDVETASPKKEVEDSVALTDRYLEPLRLPDDLRQLIRAHVAAQTEVAEALDIAAQRLLKKGADDNGNEWPVATGVSVALGYLVGGLLPLGPYLAVDNVGDGLRWSFAVCLVALFVFGFLRAFYLESLEPKTAVAATMARQLSWYTGQKRRVPWRRLWKSTCEGLQMVVLGGIAAVAAILCVRLFEGARADGSEEGGA